MTGENDLFTSLELHDISKETIIFGDNNKGDVIDLGKITILNDNSILNVYLVETLGYNLLSVSQLFEIGYNCVFTNEGVTVFRTEDSSIAFTDRLEDKVFLIDFSTEKVELKICLTVWVGFGIAD
jgi:hypothetical protein